MWGRMEDDSTHFHHPIQRACAYARLPELRDKGITDILRRADGKGDEDDITDERGDKGEGKHSTGAAAGGDGGRIMAGRVDDRVTLDGGVERAPADDAREAEAGREPVALRRR